MSTLQVYWTLVLAAAAVAKEVGVPERFLRPRNYNPHPFISTQGVGAPIDNSARVLDEHPYHLFQRVNVRGEDDSRPIQFPKVPEVAKPMKSNTPGYITVPKNYAFSYAVKDKKSGDDFSHSQAHNGQATQGEYRVKLPDGRIQVVSYTADSTGYRADVRYDKDITLVRKLHDVLYSPQPPVYNSPSNSLEYTGYEEQYTPVTYNLPLKKHYQPLIQVTTPRPQHSLFEPKLENYNLEQSYIEQPRNIEQPRYIEQPRPVQQSRYIQQPRYIEQPRFRTQPLTAAEYTSPESNYYLPDYQQKYYQRVQEPVYSSTAATPIVEEQEEDRPYSSTEAAPYSPTPSTPSSRINYLLLPQRGQEYVYSRK